MAKTDRKLDNKEAALKKQGTLNPTPHQVEDDLFKTREFFDPRDLMQVKYEMLRRFTEEGWPIKEAANKFGFSRPSFYDAQDAYRNEGLPGLLPKKRGPKSPHKITEEVIKFIEQKKEEDPSIRSVNLSKLVQEEYSLDVHSTSIDRAIERRKKKGRR